ncbi:MAG: O-methyltransferase [Parvibaculum sp.]|uniref:O-methyltransferase n=1 Tax=Parvibaculum sp. TaxID=2024848 RepID=UPI00326382D9
MSGADIPYQLRPNKYIDRQIFVDLLNRVLSERGNENFVYVSMGGKHLADHNIIYHQVGIPNLLSIDKSGNVVRRQLLNRPIDKAECWEMDSGALSQSMDAVFEKFGEEKNLVLWLDYTDPHARLMQLQEFIAILGVLQPGDILRITLNANNGSLGDESEWKKEGFESPKAFRLAKLKNQLGELVPVDLPEIGDEDLPEALVKCIELAVSTAEEQRSDVKVQPLLLTSYRDGQRMMTVAVQILPTDHKRELPAGLHSWPFKAKGWDGIVRIEAPDLSLREKQKIDRHLNRAPSYILERLQFFPAKSREASLEAIRSYKKLHRYYPEFRHVPI